MKRFILTLSIILVGFDLSAGSGHADSIYFKTPVVPPVFKPPEMLKNQYRLFQQTLRVLPETDIIKSAILFGQLPFRLSNSQVKKLFQDFTEVGEKIDSDPVLKNLPSALPYCFSKKLPKNGHYFLYYPEKANPDTQTIIFLHGAGGNFKFYLYLMSKYFPDSIILAPSWSMSWQTGKIAYLRAMWKNAQTHLHVKLRKPWLFAISAGGPRAYELYSDHPNDFAGLVALATAPYQGTINDLCKNMNILMVNGVIDKRFPVSNCLTLAKKVESRVKNFKFYPIKADHFFMLTHQEKCFSAIKIFITKTESSIKH